MERPKFGEVRQWVDKVLAYSSQYNSTTWAANSVIGAPRVYPQYGDIHGAWASKDIDANQFVELKYAEAVYIEEINIYETYHAGAVKRVSVKTPSNTWMTIYETPSVTKITSSRVFTPEILRPDFMVDEIRIDVDCTGCGTWAELDAIELVGSRFNVGKMEIISFDTEEALLRGHIPLDKIQEHLQTLEWEKILRIDFAYNGYCNDAVLKAILMSKKGTLTELLDVKLQGCPMITDIGLKWLSQIIQGATKLRMVNLDGCVKVTDTGAMEVAMAAPLMCKIYLRGTSIRHLTSVAGRLIYGSDGCAVIPKDMSKERKHRKVGGVLVVPHPSMKHSLSAFIEKQDVQNLKGYKHISNMEFDNEWKLNINEISLENPLFDMMIGEKPLEVLIPFDASAEPKEVTKHVMDTVTRVVSKEKYYPQLPEAKRGNRDSLGDYNKFMDVMGVCCCKLDLENATLENYRGFDIDDRIGCYYSRQTLSRSFPYFEIEVVDVYQPSNEEDKKTGLLIGILHECIFGKRNPMEDNSDTGGVIQSFTDVAVGDVIGFGIVGDWESEYLPGRDCKYYATKNGQEMPDPDEMLKDKILPRSHYPLVSLITGTKEGFIRVKLLHLAVPPKALLDEWKLHNKWMRSTWLNACQIDGDGFLSPSHFSTRPDDCHYVSENSIGCNDTPQSTFSVKLITGGADNKVVIGIGDEKHKFGTSLEYLAFIGTDGGVKKGNEELKSLTEATRIKEGETITFKFDIERQPITFNDKKEGKVQIYRDDQLYCECKYTFKFSGGEPTEKVIIKMVQGKRVVQILNHQPHYRRPPIAMDKITFGKVRRCETLDDGTVSCGPQFGVNTFGVFVSKTPFNEQLKYFEIKPLETSSKVSIGVSHQEKPPGFYLGMNQCEVGLHHSGELSLNALGTVKEDRKCKVGDTMGCGVEGEFDEDGLLKQQQTITVYFNRNGERIESCQFFYGSDGLYPSVMVEKSGARAQILNYYPETKEHFEAYQMAMEQAQQMAKQKQEKEKEEEEEIKEFPGCNFLMVGVGTSGSDASGKTQIVKDMSHIEDLVSPGTQIESFLRQALKPGKVVSFQEQEVVSSLHGTLEGMEGLKKNPSRLQFMSVDMSSGKGHNELKSRIVSTFNLHQKWQPISYSFSEKISTLMDKIIELVRETKLYQESDLLTTLLSTESKTEEEKKATETKIRGFKADISKILQGSPITGSVVQSMLGILRDQGSLIILKGDTDNTIVDVTFAMDLIGQLEKVAGMTMTNDVTTVLGQSSHIWKEAVFRRSLREHFDGDQGMLLRTMKEYLGLIQIPLWRKSTSDDHYLYTTLANVSTPPIPLREFWSEEEQNKKNCVMVQRTYSFPFTLPDHLMSLILSAVLGYGRLIMMSAEGAVIQMGATQTVIVQHTGGLYDNKVISIETKCYFPQKQPDGIVNDTTEANVQEYTFLIFSLFTDLIDRILQRQRLTPVISQNLPLEMVNASFGCKHIWQKSSGIKQAQTVCTLCNKCCTNGDDCEYNGLVGSYLRECPCKGTTTGCKDCGICVSCAEKIWNLRSELRPMPLTGFTSNDILNMVTLDPIAFNEVEFIQTFGTFPSLCLKNVAEGSLINVFPGTASIITEQDDKKIRSKLEILTNAKGSLGTSGKRNVIKIRLSDPLGTVTTEDIVSPERQGIQESRTVYHSSIFRECRVFQEAGIICYDSMSTALPVAQFVGPKPFSETLTKFSFKILKPGRDKAISGGICQKGYRANCQAGWGRFSIGYHSDDGGIFIESGQPRLRKETYDVGDIITVELKVKERMLYFYKNDVEMHSLKVNIPSGGYFPMVGCHSIGEVIQLLEVEPWIPTTSSDSATMKPNSFDVYKYGNLWISPARTVYLKRAGTSKAYTGWILLNNPSKSHTGYCITPKTNLKKAEEGVGFLAHNQTAVVEVYVQNEADISQIFEIKWISLDRNKEYQAEEIMETFEKVPEASIFTHRCSVQIQSTSMASDAEELVTKAVDPKPNGPKFMLEVFRNSLLINQYWLECGEYRFEIPYPSGEFVVRYPKCPSFLYPSIRKRGMKTVVKLDDSQYAEAVLTDVYEGGFYCLEYTPQDSQTNDTLCFDESMLNFNEKFDSSSANILLYKADESQKLLNRTFVTMPTYLMQEDSVKALETIDKDWKMETLQRFSQCNQNILRFTVQEQMITNLSHTLPDWLAGYGYNSWVDQAFVYLPSDMEKKTLLYPTLNGLFQDVSVHRLCSFADQLLHFQPTKKVNLRIPIHFMDMPGMKPSSPPPVDLTYACLYQGWIYTCLIANKLLLPSYSKFLTGELGEMGREEIEHLLYQLLQPYASLCSIYAAQCGGLQNQENPINGTEKVMKLIEEVDEEPLKFNRKPITESHKLIRQQRVYTCKAHQLALSGNEAMYDRSLTVEKEYFHPYSELVNVFSWDLPHLPSLPKDFFTMLPNLQYFSLESSALKVDPDFPDGIGKLTDLEYILLNKLGISKLPKDLLLSPGLSVVECKNMSVKSLEITWPSTSMITRLSLSGLLIDEVPVGICRLQELTDLNLDYNPLSTLPNELSLLTKLKVLSLKGMPLITFDGVKESMTTDQYQSWHDENPSVSMYLGRKAVMSLFDQFDDNTNAMLELKELAKLNLQLFFDIPRLGFKVDTDEYGGIPPVIYELKSLQELYLSYQGITMVTKHATSLVNLQVLDVSHCPLLEGIAGPMGLLPNIRSINLHSCPSLRTPPNEVVSRGFESVRAYLKRLAGGFTECRRTKLMFVGLGEAGKTSLLQALMSGSKKTSGTQNAQLTDGIEIKTWTIKDAQEREIIFSAWDFAGQTVYYNTHQFFLSNRAVYMLLWNMRMGFEHAGLDFWLSSIACHAPETPIIIIGTQSDQVPKPEIPEKDLRRRYPQISAFHYVSSITGDGIPDLEQSLLEVTLKQKYMGEKIPQVWLNLEKKILGERTQQSILDWSVVEQFAIEQGIYDENDVKQAIKFLDDLGTVQYFDNDFLRDKVVINPQWIVNVMACVVSVKKSPIQENDGRFHYDNIKDIWGKYDNSLHNWLLSLTEEFDLTFPLPGKNLNVVPCLLPMEPPTELKWPEVDTESGHRENKMLYKFAYLPAGLFNRAQVRLFQFSDGKMIWKKGSLLTKNHHLALIKQQSDKELVIQVQGPRPENILLLIHEVFESLIEESFHGVDYSFYIPCPDCITKEGTKEPSLFQADLIRRAKDLKAPFLQCTKYFHAVSMGQLLEMMPEDKDSDFDVHLQHSISALQSITNAMESDVALLYTQDDVPVGDDKTKINPLQIKKDIESWGYTVWSPDSGNKLTMEDFILHVKNCKIAVACVSDDYERDQQCNSMFIYAKEQLMKSIVICVISESMTWQNTDMGMKIGQPKMAMLKTVERYDKKLPDLRGLVEEYIAGTVKDNIEHPDVFISYCWANSKEACAQGTKSKPGSLGFGDPREIKSYLENHGIKCWLDIEQMGKCGLYHAIAVGLQNCKLIVACVSDEYVESEACMMELRFAVCNMGLPLVVVVVGTGKKWKRGELPLLMGRSKDSARKIYMQEESEDAYITLLESIRNMLPKEGEESKAEKKRKKMMMWQKQQESSRKLAAGTKQSFQEEYELIQRKFIRHIINITQSLELQTLPRLLVFDFVKSVPVKRETVTENRPETRGSVDAVNLNEESERPLTSKTPKPVSRKSNLTSERVKAVLAEGEDEEDWQAEEFCIKVMCEHEEGWHLVENSLSLVTYTSEEVFQVIKEAAPYLARIYTILRQSSVKLNVLSGKVGENFIKYLEQEGKSIKNFLGAYLKLHKLVTDHTQNEDFQEQLSRCHLPSGKISWLCPTHSTGNRITKLAIGSSSTHGVGKSMLNREDELLKEFMPEHPGYQKWKAMAKSELELSFVKPPVTKEGNSTGDKKSEKEGKNEVSREKSSDNLKNTSVNAEKDREKKMGGEKKKTPERKVSRTTSKDVKIDLKQKQMNGEGPSNTTSQNSSTVTSPDSTKSRPGFDTVARTSRTLQRHYSKSGRQKSQACVLQ